MTAKYITITPTKEKDSEGFHTAILKAYSKVEDAEGDNPSLVRYIDSFSIEGEVCCDFEYTEDGAGVRLWSGIVNGLLSFDDSYGPRIYSL